MGINLFQLYHNLHVSDMAVVSPPPERHFHLPKDPAAALLLDIRAESPPARSTGHPVQTRHATMSHGVRSRENSLHRVGHSSRHNSTVAHVHHESRALSRSPSSVGIDEDGDRSRSPTFEDNLLARRKLMRSHEGHSRNGSSFGPPTYQQQGSTFHMTQSPGSADTTDSVGAFNLMSPVKDGMGFPVRTGTAERKARRDHAIKVIDTCIDLLEACNTKRSSPPAALNAVVAFMDKDMSGEVEVDEFEAALLAQRHGLVKDEQVAKALKRIENELHMRHLRVGDMFALFDTDGGGSLSRAELKQGLTMLCSEDHDTVIATRMRQHAVREAAQKKRERKRQALIGFLHSLDSVLPEMMGGREFFAVDEKDETQFIEIVRLAALHWDEEQTKESNEKVDTSRTSTLPSSKSVTKSGKRQSMSRSRSEASGVTRGNIHHDNPMAQEAKINKIRQELSAPTKLGTPSNGSKDDDLLSNLLRRQMVYNRNDALLKELLQKKFEQEQLPNLFSSRMSSKKLKYNVQNEFELMTQQAKRINRSRHR